MYGLPAHSMQELNAGIVPTIRRMMKGYSVLFIACLSYADRSYFLDNGENESNKCDAFRNYSANSSFVSVGSAKKLPFVYQSCLLSEFMNNQMESFFLHIFIVYFLHTFIPPYSDCRENCSYSLEMMEELF